MQNNKEIFSKLKIIILASIFSLLTMNFGFQVARQLYYKQVTKTESQQTNTTHTVIKTIKDKAGREKTVTEIVSKIDTKTDTIISKPLESGRKTNISALVGNDFSKSLPKPIYGVSFSREFIGPVTIGAFGFNNGLLGVSVGLNF